MTTPYMVSDIRADEGLRLVAYEDDGGVWTIGYGHTGNDVCEGLTWTPAQAELALAHDLYATQQQLDARMAWWRDLDDPRQDVVVNMAFNLGVGGLQRFTFTLEDIEEALAAVGPSRDADFKAAATAMLASTWARQVGRRATRLSLQMATGVRA